MGLTCCGYDGGFGIDPVDWILASDPLSLSLPFSGQQVGVVFQTVHVWQQQLRWFQGHHVLQVVVLVPRGKDIGMNRVCVQGNAGGGGGW